MFYVSYLFSDSWLTNSQNLSRLFAFWSKKSYKIPSETMWSTAALFWWPLSYFSRAAGGKKPRYSLTLTAVRWVFLFLFFFFLIPVKGNFSFYEWCSQHDSPQNFYRIQLLLWLQEKLKRLLFDLIFPPAKPTLRVNKPRMKIPNLVKISPVYIRWQFRWKSGTCGVNLVCV